MSEAVRLLELWHHRRSKRTGYRFTNSSTFFLMVACSDFNAEYSLDKSRCRVSSSRSDVMSRLTFRIVRDPNDMTWCPETRSSISSAARWLAKGVRTEMTQGQGTVAFEGAA